MIHDVNVIYNELFEIWAKRIKSKNFTIEAFEFERDAGRLILKQAEMLSNLTWKNSGYNKFKIHHPDRLINAPRYEDRIGQTWIVEKYVKPYVSPKLIDNNMACQDGKGSMETMRRVKQGLKNCFESYGYDFYVFQFDMEGYYDNLSHDVIKRQFSDLPESGYKLICNIIDGWRCKDSYAAIEDPVQYYGAPKGCLPSQWIGIQYLNELDHLIREEVGCEFDIRYMDDGLYFLKTREKCARLKGFIEDYLKSNHMGIRLHPNKTNYAPINRGFNFCGWHYEIKPSGKILIHLKQEKKKEMIEALKYLQLEYERGRISWSEAKTTIQGRMKYLEWGDTYHLRKYLCNRFTFQRGRHSPCAKLTQGNKLLTEEEHYNLFEMPNSEIIV